MWLEITVIIVLTIVNGLLAMAELSIASSRPLRLASMVEKGTRGARAVVALREDPGRFLSAVQVGITLIGILNGAVSGATLGARASNALIQAGVPVVIAAPLGVGIVVAIITYLSLVVGELVPKSIAMANPEGIAARLAPSMVVLARIAAPLVWVLTGSTRLIMRLARISAGGEHDMTDDDVRMTIAEATRQGVLLHEERGMIAGVMRVADRSARAMMTPRREVETIDLADPPDVVLAKAKDAKSSRIPVSDGGSDNIVGVIALRDVIGLAHPDVRALLRDAPVVLDGASAMSVVAVMRQTPERMVLVYDELGHFQGIITAMDLLEAIAGDFADGAEDEPDIVRRADGSWLVAGAESADEFAGETGFPQPLPDGDYSTVAGLALAILGHIPRTGETFTHEGWKFEIADMDAMRIDRLIVTAPLEVSDD